MLPNSICDYLDDASFKWHLRCQAIHAPDCDLKGLETLDDQIDTNLDGLRSAGKEGWDLCVDALDHGSAMDYFAASMLAFTHETEDRRQHLLGLGAGDPDYSNGIISALGWLPFKVAESPIRSLLASQAPDHRRIGLVNRQKY